MNGNYKIKTKTQRKKISPPHGFEPWHGPLELKSSVLPMSNADPWLYFVLFSDAPKFLVQPKDVSGEAGQVTLQFS